MTARDAGGVTTSDQSPMNVQMDPCDWLDRMTKAKFKKDADSAWKYTSYTYDENGNVKTQLDNATDGQSGTGITHTYTYYETDWLKAQVDDNGTSTLSDDQKILNFWYDTGWERERQVYRDASNYAIKQTTHWDWFENGLLQTLTTRKGGSTGAILETHIVGYEDPQGIYVNGNRTRDDYGLTGPTATVCSDVTVPLSCTAKYTYDARDRLTQYEDGHGGTSTYDLDPIGNVKKQVTPTATTTFTYQGAQTKTRTDTAGTHNYFYDSLGNLDCIMGASYSKCPDGPDKTGLEVDYAYDYLSRLDAYAAYSGGTKTDSADYTYDALDRLAKESETHSGIPPRTSTFTYLGLTDLMTKDAQKNTSTGAGIIDKTYSYDAYGHRVSMTDDPSGSSSPITYTYGYDVHGSASLLLDPNGAAKASYGSDPYGNKDTGLSKGDTTQTNPYNPFRYSAKRFDSGSQTVDTGARRFSSGSLYFLQQDMFQGALDDLSLTTDPLTNNRYALAGGNPVSFKEWDGHVPAFDGGGMASGGPNPTQYGGGAGPPSHDSLFGHVGGFVKGFFEQAADLVKGAASVGWGAAKWTTSCAYQQMTACGHGVHTAITAVSNLRHPTRAWRAYTASIRADWRSGKKDEAVGRVGFEVLTFVVAAAKGVKAVRALRAAGAVDAAGEIAVRDGAGLTAAETDLSAIKAGAAGGESAGKVFAERVRAAALEENPDTCVFCRMQTDTPQVDHAIPRVRGGSATLDNAQTTCPWCNASKGARDFPMNPPPDFEGQWPPPWFDIFEP